MTVDVASATPRPGRFLELEGLRGIASIMVVLAHFIFLFFPAMRKGEMSLAHHDLEKMVHGTPVSMLWDGTLAVAIFFVMSGFVLSIGFFQTGNTNIVKKLATGRYLRLMLPALASAIIAWILIQAGAGRLTSAAGEVAGSSNLAKKWQFDPSLFDVIKAGTLDVFVEYKGGGSAINNVLWTMNVEFLGSFLVFGFLLLFAQSRLRWLAYVALLIGTFDTWYLGFIIGMMIADAHSLGWLERFKRWYVTLPLIIVTLFFASFPRKHKGTIYEVFDLGFIGANERVTYLTLASTLALLVVLLSASVAKVLRTKFMSTLGRYTFSLYLTHLLVIFTVSSAVVIFAHDKIGYNAAALLAFLVSLPVFIIVAFLFERYIDAPSIKFARFVGAVYRGERTVEGPDGSPQSNGFREGVRSFFTRKK